MVSPWLRTSGGFLTFAFVGRAVGEGVSIETVLAAVTEEAIRVVDALETFSGFTVTVPHRIWVNVVAALAGATSSASSALAQRVSEEAIIAEFTAFTCRDTNSLKEDCPRQSSRSETPSWAREPPGTQPTRGSCGTVGADHLSAPQDNSTGGSSWAGTRLAVGRSPATGVAIETLFTAFTTQTGCVVLTVTRSWTKEQSATRQQSQKAGKSR